VCEQGALLLLLLLLLLQAQHDRKGVCANPPHPAHPLLSQCLLSLLLLLLLWQHFVLFASHHAAAAALLLRHMQLTKQWVCCSIGDEPSCCKLLNCVDVTRID
jgi:hypothetical protein